MNRIRKSLWYYTNVAIKLSVFELLLTRVYLLRERGFIWFYWPPDSTFFRIRPNNILYTTKHKFGASFGGSYIHTSVRH